MDNLIVLRWVHNLLKKWTEQGSKDYKTLLLESSIVEKFNNVW